MADRGNTGQTSLSVVLPEGLIFSSDDGDPVDVYFTRDTRSKGCMNVGAFYYGTTISCFDLDGPEGSYVVVPPSAETTKPSIVVGVMPGDAAGATVHVGQTRVRAKTRGRWFLASLEPGALGPNNTVPVSVEFDRR